MNRLYGPHADRVLAGLYRHRANIEIKRDAALAAMARYGTADPDDWDEYDRAAAAHDAASNELADINARIEEIEDGEARSYERTALSGYWASR